MVVKELDTPSRKDRFAQAGHKAEEQMAFYLKRAFEHDKRVRVFNGIRLEKNGDVAQMDHLILHRYGVVVIESKSVTTQVAINEREEWSRYFRGRWSGMPSPVLQAKRQALFLAHYLDDHTEALLRKLLGMVQTGFGSMARDVLVAISDSGQIKRSGKGQLDEVVKADQVPEKVRDIIRRYDRISSVFNLNPASFKDAPRSFSEDELERITAFLLEHHKPAGPEAIGEDTELAGDEAEAAEPQVVDAAPAASLNGYQCRHCQSVNLMVAYGRYGYYFKCLDCEGNTPINESCGNCGKKTRVRKEGDSFYAECSDCKTSRRFYTNPSGVKV